MSTSCLAPPHLTQPSSPLAQRPAPRLALPCPQMTIMSRACAERNNLLRLMDRRWQGTAVGVGSAKILGEGGEARGAGWGGGGCRAGDSLAPVCVV